MKTVLYVCVHNAGRSQMAVAFTNSIAAERKLSVRGLSGGTIAGEIINPQAVVVMAEVGISMADQFPKQLTQQMVDNADKVITMGCGVDVDACPARITIMEDWGLNDPKGRPVEEVRVIRDQIAAKVKAFIHQIAAEN